MSKTLSTWEDHVIGAAKSLVGRTVGGLERHELQSLRTWYNRAQALLDDPSIDDKLKGKLEKDLWALRWAYRAMDAGEPMGTAKLNQAKNVPQETNISKKGSVFGTPPEPSPFDFSLSYEQQRGPVSVPQEKERGPVQEPAPNNERNAKPIETTETAALVNVSVEQACEILVKLEAEALREQISYPELRRGEAWSDFLHHRLAKEKAGQALVQEALVVWAIYRHQIGNAMRQEQLAGIFKKGRPKPGDLTLEALGLDKRFAQECRDLSGHSIPELKELIRNHGLLTKNALFKKLGEANKMGTKLDQLNGSGSESTVDSSKTETTSSEASETTSSDKTGDSSDVAALDPMRHLRGFTHDLRENPGYYKEVDKFLDDPRIYENIIVMLEQEINFWGAILQRARERQLALRANP